MKLNYKDVKTDRQWRATVGLSKEKFEDLSNLFKQCYEGFHGISLEKGAANLKKTLLLGTYEDCLFYVLFQLKNGLTYDVLGFLAGTDSTNARRLFEQHQKLLEMTLFQTGHLPKRNFESVAELKELLKNESEIILDVTEVGVERKSNYEAQKQDYSGKKKAHQERASLEYKRS